MNDAIHPDPVDYEPLTRSLDSVYELLDTDRLQALLELLDHTPGISRLPASVFVFASEWIHLAEHDRSEWRMRRDENSLVFTRYGATAIIIISAETITYRFRSRDDRTVFFVVDRMPPHALFDSGVLDSEVTRR